MTKKKQHNIKTTSKKTGLYILILTVVIIAFGSVFFTLAIMESNEINQNENNFRLMSCQDMLSDFEKSPEQWKHTAIKDKGCFD